MYQPISVVGVKIRFKLPEDFSSELSTRKSHEIGSRIWAKTFWEKKRKKNSIDRILFFISRKVFVKWCYSFNSLIKIK